jgi:hypothetical protein
MKVFGLVVMSVLEHDPAEERHMKSSRLLGVAVLFAAAAFMILATGCLGNSTAASTPTGTPIVLMPQPQVESVVASTSGTQSGYFAILNIKVKNSGAEGTILVQASVTQNGRISQNEMPVYLQQGEEHELKLTFPLVWKGGDFTCNVQAVLPSSSAGTSGSSAAPSQSALFSSQTVSQGPNVQTIVYTFTPAYSGHTSITGTSSSSTGYLLVTNTSSGVSNNYIFGTGTAVSAPLTANNSYSIYFGNHDSSGLITATLTGIYQP